MKKIESLLQEELTELRHVIEKTQQRLRNVPLGTLRIRCKKGKVEYYYRNRVADNPKENNSNGRYLRKNEVNLAKAIAQRDYDIAVNKKATERMKALKNFLKSYEKTDLENLYQEVFPERRKLIEPVIITDEEYVKDWQTMEYQGKKFADDEVEITTERGERVRSKSEKIIADKLLALGISYRYEFPLTLVGNVKVYPDFTILKMPERKEVYLEHFGMMDDEEYVDNVMFKLNAYEKSGIYLGDKLFFTHETSKNPLNTRVLDGMLRTMFCEEK